MTLSQILTRRSSRSKIVSGSTPTSIESQAQGKVGSHKRSSSLRSFINRFSGTQSNSRLRTSPKHLLAFSEPSTPIIISSPIPPSIATDTTNDIPVTPVQNDKFENQVLNYDIVSLQALFLRIMEELDSSPVQDRVQSTKENWNPSDSLYSMSSVIVYPNDLASIKRRSLEISFDDEALSHSTSRNEDPIISLSKEFDKVNYTEYGSITNADIQTFKPYSTSRSKLKLVFTEREEQADKEYLRENLQNKILSRKLSRNSIIDDLSLDDPMQEVCLQQALETSSKVQLASIEKSTDDIVGFEFNSNEQVYRNEMMILVESHKRIVTRQQDEIKNLKKLLEQERNFNKILRSPKQSVPTSSTAKIPTFRRKFIPMSIEVDCPPIRAFNLLPPFNPPSELSHLDVKQDTSASSISPKSGSFPINSLKNLTKPSQNEPNNEVPHTKKPSKRDSFSSIICPTSILRGRKSATSSKVSSRISGSSTLYYSALEDYAQIGETTDSLPRRSLAPLIENQRKDSVASSTSSIMSNPHHNTPMEKEVQSGISHSISNSLSSYTIHSNSTTPESVNYHSSVFSKLHAPNTK
ncbi:uncharacterized protein CANTADRAFT_243737 [Suhomyces tanzawaensis NRRL Y-17324]|uniref:Uncharacterized protein n=1 Tax=Suhomyces tanzawaensis NRRL Y-17324 TaxID=984487 RepID=A0A1E4SHQ9_9ASCO|nr:uncharacterized protein CANTADRAFT_243737 [Suhomyces tanzawaensis NRRL Y-17324]ODV79033.1 hypothetical protein CANTADRAFT_243737 [Suhomyces tanzawaensis NRRL Y-17324]